MRFADRHHIIRASLVLLLIPLLAAVDACGDVPIGSDAGGAGGAGSTSSMSSTSSTSSMSSTSSTGGGLPCQPGAMVPCYSGPPGTQGVGICKAGTQTCNPNGMAYGPCIGQVMPAAEICDAAMKDENCDGYPGCQCGDGTLDPGESCDDGNTMDGDTCPATCLRSVSSIELGSAWSCVFLDGGGLKCWGDAEQGRLGTGDTMNRGDNPGEMGDNLPLVDLGTGKIPVVVSAGDQHTCAILNNGSVKCWGANSESQLGLGDTENRGDNPGEMGDNLPTVNLGTGKTAVAISAGGRHTCAILNDGSLKCWGWNISGQLGLGDTNNRGDNPSEMGDNLPAVDLGTGKTAVAIAAGIYHTCARLNDNSVKCWGVANQGALGLGDTNNRGDDPKEMGDNLPAVDLGTGKTAVIIAAGLHTCALLNDSNVKCWGLNTYGELGLGDTNNRGDDPNEMGDNLPAVDLGTGKSAVAVDTSYENTCALLTDGSVKCWGRNQWGQLGLGDTNNRGDKPNQMGNNLPAVDLGAGAKVSSISVETLYTCALLDGGRVKCWGANGEGELGLGDTNNRGDNPGEMGDNLPFTAP